MLPFIKNKNNLTVYNVHALFRDKTILETSLGFKLRGSQSAISIHSTNGLFHESFFVYNLVLFGSINGIIPFNAKIFGRELRIRNLRSKYCRIGPVGKPAYPGGV